MGQNFNRETGKICQRCSGKVLTVFQYEEWESICSGCIQEIKFLKESEDGISKV